ncbi:phosphatidate cytidylyltransferase [Halodesulfovibrio sp.]|uniref:phosphatidate cytidylyltransferase n=1 Tax=Halodesulfovibrio sp. TaxID=1912772 RepID=UPI0025EB0DF8|nr:phosphatidate cytidylyltransferase [Halodesulfovibrio sp.]MCT4535479.1 phosphatidate cytidylyltransferase [Halodesulfovibrio sp.]MCT4626292.1 phosphatidate cytidylyltransferase [Halodesulfovibrio sp.]
MTNSHRQRWMTALIALPVLIAILVIGDWALLAGILAASVIGQYEFYTMFWARNEKMTLKLFGCLMGIAILIASYLNLPHAVIGFIALTFWISNFAFLGKYGITMRDDASFPQSQIITGGVLYLPVLLQAVFSFQRIELILILLAAFASDIGGFYAGRFFGKNKIWPRVSPKKTIEGSLGGMLGCCLVTVSLGLAFGTAPWYLLILLGIVLNCASQLGDFFESALKRTVGVKDSGAILPGHGGVLDRIDSILLVLPTYWFAQSIYSFF